MVEENKNGNKFVRVKENFSISLCLLNTIVRSIPKPVKREKLLQRTLSFLLLVFVKGIPKPRGTKFCIDLALQTLHFLRHSEIKNFGFSAVKNNLRIYF